MTGQHNHRQIGKTLLDFLQGGVSVHTGHFNIQDHDIRVFAQHLHGLFAACRQNRLKTLSV